MMNFTALIDGLCTQGFYVCDAFLPHEHYSALSAKAQELYAQGQFHDAKVGAIAQENKTLRSDHIFWIDEAQENTSIHTYLHTMQQLMQVLNQSLFLSLSELETHFAVYPPQTYYKKHVDQFMATKTRKISCVYYLNQEWHEAFGGQLTLYDAQDQLLEEVIPKGNRFVCFNSTLAHEVSMTQHPRYSITGWMKTRR